MSSIKKYQPNYTENNQKNSELDNYSTLIVEDLLQGTNEWRNIDEIIKITFKALTDIVKQQGDSIIDLQNMVQLKVNKNEFVQGLQLKASLSDVQRTISEISNLLDSKVSTGDINNIRKDFVLKSDLSYILNDRPNTQEIQALMNNNNYNFAQSTDLKNLYQKFDELQNEFIKNVTNSVTQKEFEAILIQLENKANIAEVNEALEQKANKQSIQTALHRKANKAQIDGLIARKADITDLQNIVDILEQKVDNQVLEKITNILDGKVDKHEQSYFLNCLQNDKDEILNLNKRIEDLNIILEKKIIDEKQNTEQIEILQKNIQKKQSLTDQNELEELKQNLIGEIYKLKDDFQGLKRLMDDNLQSNQNSIHEQFDCIQKEIQVISKKLNQKHSEVETQVEENLLNYQKNIKNKFYKEFEQINEQFEVLRSSTEELRQKKLDKKEHQDHKIKTLQEIGQKLDNSELQSAFNVFQNEINRKIIELREEFKHNLRQLESEFSNNLKQKANKEDLLEGLASKSDQSQMHQLQQTLLEVQQHQKATHQKLQEDSSQLRNCITFNEFNDNILNSKKLMDLMQRDLQLKANITDVCTIFDSKASIQSVNETLQEIHKELDSKCNSTDFLLIQKDQSIINENFCFENMIGRWRWRSSDLQQGNLIPWDLQIVNTIPNNYLWEKDSPNLIIVEQGIYQFSLGIFARKKVQIKILINGENVLSSSDSVNNENFNPNTKKYKTFGSHKDGYITGVTLVDFINVPARSRLAIQYKGEMYGDEEGLMILKKL